MRGITAFFLGLFLFGQAADAEVFDMRACSRRRGFKPYTVKQAYVPPTRPRAVVEPVRHAMSDSQSNSVNQSESERKIRQTGVKVFQEKDEAKVLNFKVENPEFDKLSDYKKQDLMQRISFQGNTGVGEK